MGLGGTPGAFRACCHPWTVPIAPWCSQDGGLKAWASGLSERLRAAGSPELSPCLHACTPPLPPASSLQQLSHFLISFFLSLLKRQAAGPRQLPWWARERCSKLSCGSDRTKESEAQRGWELRLGSGGGPPGAVGHLPQFSGAGELRAGPRVNGAGWAS